MPHIIDWIIVGLYLVSVLTSIALLDSKKDARRVKVYIEPADWWIGYYRGPNHHYVCPMPLVVIRWARRPKPPGGSDA